MRWPFAVRLRQAIWPALLLDVYTVEPAKENILFDAPNLVATPHLGASTAEAQEKVAIQVAEQLSDYLLDGAVMNAINMPNVTAEEAPILVPYMHWQAPRFVPGPGYTE